MKYELIDHGPEHSQYFQGCGTAHTQYDECATGIGNDPREALDDCLNGIAQQTSAAFVEELERLILADFPAFTDAAKIAAATVDRGQREIEDNELRIEELEAEIEECTDDGMIVSLRHEIDGLQDKNEELEETDSELWYHISIRYCHAENLDDAHEDDLLDFAEDEDNDIVLRAYAKLKTEAMRHRLSGRIETALQTERLLEHLYNNLPQHLRW